MRLRKYRFKESISTDGIMYLKPVRILWERKKFRRQNFKVYSIKFVRRELTTFAKA